MVKQYEAQDCSSDGMRDAAHGKQIAEAQSVSGGVWKSQKTGTNKKKKEKKKEKKNPDCGYLEVLCKLI